MRYGKIRGTLLAAAGGLMAALPGSAVAQQTTTTSALPQTGPGTPETPPTTVTQRPTPENYTRYKQARFAKQDVAPKHVTAAFQMTREDTAPTRGFTAPTSMLVDPENPSNIVAAVANLRNRTCHLLRSTDAGRSWKFTKSPPSLRDYPYCTSSMAGVPEAVIAWGRNHTLYYGLMAYDVRPGQEGPRDGRASIALARSTDLGETWKVTLVDNNRGKTGPEPQNQPSDTGVTGLAVDTSGPRDVVYVGFSQSFPSAPTGSPLTNPRPMVATSTDGGETFGPPVMLNDFTNLTRTIDGKPYKILMRTGFGAPFLVAHDGVIMAVTGSDFPSGEAPAPPHSAGQGLSPGTFYAYPNPQLVARSTDQGKTWTVKELGPPIYAGTGSYTGLGWVEEGGPEGTFVAVYAATPETSSTTGLADLVVQRSKDGGQTWTEPLAIDDDKPEQHATSFYPQLQVAPNGRIDVVWQDNRDVGDFRFNVRYTYSTDGGETWAPNVQVTDRPVDFNFGISYNSDIRFPPGVASSNYYAFVGWADSRLANDLTQTQDVFGANVQFKALPATTNTTLPIVAAIFGGLVVAGIVLLVVLKVRRRGGPTAPPQVERPERVSAD